MSKESITVGRHLIIGFEGTEATPKLLEFIREEEIGGVILFARNLESCEQITHLIQTLKTAVDYPLFVGVDHEGGRVFRLPKPFTVIPPAREFGHYFDRTGDTTLIETIAFDIAQELKAVGFNLNFAPILDVDTCAENPIIGDRSFHCDPDIIATIATAFVQGFTKAGVLSCGKHFPGHGDTKEDSHKTLPVIEKTKAELAACELIPFRQLITAGIPSLMTAHVLYPQVDPIHPATLSPYFNKDLLRHSLGFEGVLFSDDLLMKGITQHHSVPEATVATLQAGCDAVLICRDFTLQQEAVRTLKREVQKKKALQQHLRQAGERLQKLREGLSVTDTQKTPLSSANLPKRLAQLQES